MLPDELFKDELETFRKEETIAQQYFYSWLQMRNEFGSNRKLLDRINDTPTFWVTAHHALILATFVALGRIFDQGSRHNVDSLVRAAIAHRDIFSRASLKARRIRDGLDPQFAEEYVQDKYQPGPDDFRQLRAEVSRHRKIYVSGLRDVRDKIYAHREVAGVEAANALLEKARIDDLQAPLRFLHAPRCGSYSTMGVGQFFESIRSSFRLIGHCARPRWLRAMWPIFFGT